MATLLLQNVAFYSLQIAVLAVMCGVLLRLFQLRIPTVRVISWQLLMAACLALPFIQPWLAAYNSSDIQIIMGPPMAADSGHHSSGFAVPWATIALAIIAAGILVRFGTLAVGFWRLRRYRRTSTFVPGAFAGLQQRFGVFADVQVSHDVSGPVTFGILRPVILLPETCLHNESVACHELLHVRRRDWLFTVIEECILSVFWFHPAMWWMVAEIQLAREEAVDREVVAMLNSRDQYLESLLGLAASQAGLDLVPASPFLRKRHLQKRIASLLKEVSMSRFRLTSSLAAFAAALALAGWLSVRSFPLQAAPQEIDSPNITVHAGSLPLLHRTPVIYPKEAKGVAGTVVLELSLSESGAVKDARVISGPEELRKVALESVLEWHYAHDTPLPPKTEVSIDFKPAAESSSAMPMAPPDELAKVDRVSILAPEPIKEKLQSQLTLHEGDRITQAALNDLAKAMKEIDEHLKLALYPNATKSGSIVFITLEGATPSSPGKRIRVGGNAQAANIVNKVPPIYPVEAKQNHIQGVVRFTVIIGKDGVVKSVTLVSGDPLLAEAAKAAVEKWVYRPTLLNGDPVEVVTQVDVNFTLLP